MKGGHSKRAEKVRNFASHNKVFTVFAVILIIFLLFHAVNQNTQQSETAQEEQTITEESTEASWRFYPIDLVILGVGGGFCTVMIVRERKKSKEGLR